MAADLQALNENLPAPAGLKIQHVEDDASWRLFGRIAALANGSPESECGVSMDFWHAIFCAADPGRTLAYIAWWNDQPVATSILMLAAGVAGIYGVVTIPEVRRKGIGARVTLRPLLDARAMGYQAGVLGASQMGFGVYRSLGFRQVCTMNVHSWQSAR